MTSTAVILLLISAFMHAGWNLLGKHRQPSAAAFLVASVVGVLGLFPVLILYREILDFLTRQSCLLVFVTGFFQTVYYASLAEAYKTGDMSIAYPLARSSSVIMVTIVSFMFGKGGQISKQSLYGMILVVLGGFILPMRRFNDFRWQNYLNTSCGLAMLAAIGTAGYSIIDDEALRLLRQASNGAVAVWKISLVYAFFEALTSFLWLFLFVFGRKEERRILRAIVAQQPGFALLMGFGIYLTYSLVLISMAFVSDVSYVVAFRQASIPLGVLLSVIILKEPAYAPKFAGVVVMFIGLVLVGSG